MVKKSASRLSLKPYSEWSLKRKLFACMFLLAVLVLAVLLIGMILFGRTHNTADIYKDTLTMQMEVFHKDISTHFDHLAASALSLSSEATAIIEDNLNKKSLAFSELLDSKEDISELQMAMLEPLKHKLLQTSCSGAFIMLDITVNSSIPDAALSKAGIYLQTSGYQRSNQEVLLYRGAAEIAKASEIMTHRKWRLEFRSDLFPDYESIASDTSPIYKAYRISKPFALPGTSDRVILLTVPVRSNEGVFYGVCGYEISASYFMTHHTQPSLLPHLSCLLATKHKDRITTSEAMHCGGTDGYFYSLAENYSLKKTDGGLMEFSDDSFSYIGVTKGISLTDDGDEHLLAVMLPREDYERACLGSFARNCTLFVLLFFFTFSFCRYFSRKFLSPLLTALDRIKSNKRTEADSSIPEILDLIAYLDEQDREHGDAVDALEEKHRAAEKEQLRLKAEYDSARAAFSRVEEDYEKAKSELMGVQKEIERLAYSRKAEIDPADYDYFIKGLNTLTKTERKLFDLYISGKSAEEILSLTGIKESTLKFHNHNLLGKLGVSSRKQMLRYAEIMLQQNKASEISDQS